MSTVKVSKKRVALLIRDAAAVLDKYGWVQWGLGDRVAGFCLIGALIEADGCGLFCSSTAPLFAAAKRSLFNRLNGRCLSAFNDDAVRIKSDVTRLLRRTARELEHGGEL